MVNIKENEICSFQLWMDLVCEGFLSDQTKLVGLDFSICNNNVSSLNLSIAIWVHLRKKPSELQKDFTFKEFRRNQQESTIQSTLPYSKYGIYSQVSYNIEPTSEVIPKNVYFCIGKNIDKVQVWLNNFCNGNLTAPAIPIIPYIDVEDDIIESLNKFYRNIDKSDC